MSRRRLALVLVPLLGVALAGTSSAAPKPAPQVKDAVGDAAGGQAGTDIVSVLYSTNGKGSGRSYVPKQLVVTMTLAGPVRSEPVLTYEVEATTTSCGDVTFTMEQGTPYQSITGLNGWADWGDCMNAAGDGSIELLTATVDGNKIRWEFGLKGTGLKPGTVFSNFRARVDPSNPAVPFPSSTTGTELGLVDGATGKGTWKLG